MRKRFIKLVFLVLVVLNLCGCVATMCMLAESAKAKQKLNLPYNQALDVVKAAFRTINVQFEGALIRPTVAEVKGKYVDGKTVRIFISKLSDDESLIAVRVGTSQAGKKDAELILKSIIEYADLVAH